MSDFAEFYRFRLDKCDFHTCEAVKNWHAMSDKDMSEIRAKWRLEDERIKAKEENTK
ncbi:unnamed protein product [marine sediment metagenome]|uniref:HMG box domain-containing protein n=1 Tax=marine sediment metagenome TaxID=412755 RepID=X0X7K9_9ZZZZ